jgi:hypothetical protein
VRQLRNPDLLGSDRKIGMRRRRRQSQELANAGADKRILSCLFIMDPTASPNGSEMFGSGF